MDFAPKSVFTIETYQGELNSDMKILEKVNVVFQ